MTHSPFSHDTVLCRNHSATPIGFDDHRLILAVISCHDCHSFATAIPCWQWPFLPNTPYWQAENFLPTMPLDALHFVTDSVATISAHSPYPRYPEKADAEAIQILEHAARTIRREIIQAA